MHFSPSRPGSALGQSFQPLRVNLARMKYPAEKEAYSGEFAAVDQVSEAYPMDSHRRRGSRYFSQFHHISPTAIGWIVCETTPMMLAGEDRKGDGSPDALLYHLERLQRGRKGKYVPTLVTRRFRATRKAGSVYLCSRASDIQPARTQCSLPRNRVAIPSSRDKSWHVSLLVKFGYELRFGSPRQ